MFSRLKCFLTGHQFVETAPKWLRDGCGQTYIKCSKGYKVVKE